MNGCCWQKNWYVPAVLNRHVPLQSAGLGRLGSGGTGPTTAPVVWVQEVGCDPRPVSGSPNATLWELPPFV